MREKAQKLKRIETSKLNVQEKLFLMCYYISRIIERFIIKAVGIHDALLRKIPRRLGVSFFAGVTTLAFLELVGVEDGIKFNGVGLLFGLKVFALSGIIVLYGVHCLKVYNVFDME